ncbi:hypothetical protein KWC93_001739 [Staphylococcus pseudintermedius]|nr:hypothetical protein [Staphylococcus pseudintermedius]
MEFIIRRSSLWSEDKPLENAYKKQVEYRDIRILPSFKHYDIKFDEAFTDKGLNHKVNKDSNIERTFIEEEWCLDVDSLNDLVELSKQDDVIVSHNKEYNLPILEIYDDYRE